MKVSILEIIVYIVVLGLICGVIPMLALAFFYKYPMALIPFVLFSILIFICGNCIED